MDNESDCQPHEFTDLVEWARVNVHRKFHQSDTSRDELHRVERVDSASTNSTIESPFGSRLTTPVDEETAMDFGYPVVQDLVEGGLEHSPPFKEVTSKSGFGHAKQKSAEEIEICHDDSIDYSGNSSPVDASSQLSGVYVPSAFVIRGVSPIRDRESTSQRGISVGECCYGEVDLSALGPTQAHDHNVESVECLFDAQIEEEGNHLSEKEDPRLGQVSNVSLDPRSDGLQARDLLNERSVGSTPEQPAAKEPVSSNGSTSVSQDIEPFTRSVQCSVDTSDMPPRELCDQGTSSVEYADAGVDTSELEAEWPFLEDEDNHYVSDEKICSSTSQSSRDDSATSSRQLFDLSTASTGNTSQDITQYFTPEVNPEISQFTNTFSAFSEDQMHSHYGQLSPETSRTLDERFYPSTMATENASHNAQNLNPDMNPSESSQFTNAFNAILQASGLPIVREDSVRDVVDVEGAGENVSTNVLAPSSTKSLDDTTEESGPNDSSSETSPLLGSLEDRKETQIFEEIAGSAPTEVVPDLQTDPQVVPAIELARDVITPLGVSTLKTILVYSFRAILFVPWCCLVGGTILLAPKLLAYVAFLPLLTGMDPAPTGIRRFQHWGQTAAEFCTIFAGAFFSLLWLIVLPFPIVQHELPFSIAYMTSQVSTKNMMVAVSLFCIAAGRCWYVWKDFKVNRRVELGEDDWQSVGMILWGDVDEIGDYKRGRGLKRTERGGYLACVSDEDEAARYDGIEKDPFIED